MSKLHVDQKTILELFSDKKSDFLIPDYQRPYAWGEEECRTLWDDIFNFTFPNDNYEDFNENEEYFLGSIVTFINKDNKKMEVIDGQQRLTTILLLLRAFYDIFQNMQDKKSQSIRKMISQCIWKTDTFEEPNYEVLKINSEVATDNDKNEFLNILKTGKVYKDQNSKYAKNFLFFQEKIEEFLKKPSYFHYLPASILRNCILLPIDADKQDTALRIFSTLNDRGKPLSDSDIFKAQLYKFYSDKGKKESFINQWKELDEKCQEIFNPLTGTPMDELFTKYMYYARSKQGIRLSTTEGLRKFYEKNNYELLKTEETFDNLIILAKFWQDVVTQNNDRFSTEVLKKFYVLNYAPNSMWNYFVSVYFMHKKDSEERLEDNEFLDFLSKIIAFIWTYAVTNPGVNALRTPVYAEMIKIVNDISVDFADFKFDINSVKISFENYSFLNIRPITKSMLTWWAFRNNDQSLLSIDTKFDIEHIFSRKRHENDQSLQNDKNFDVLGNKSLLEKRINIRASDYRFVDKINYYKGFTNSKGKQKEGTNIIELLQLTEKYTDFTENNIIDRNKIILDEFYAYLGECNLIK